MKQLTTTRSSVCSQRVWKLWGFRLRHSMLLFLIVVPPPPSPDGVTLHQLVCDLIADILTEATDAAQRDLYNRQRAGRIAAQKQGVNLGRPSKKCSDKRFSKIRDLYESHQISAEESAQRLHVSVSTFYRWLRESREHD